MSAVQTPEPVRRNQTLRRTGSAFPDPALAVSCSSDVSG